MCVCVCVCVYTHDLPFYHTYLYNIYRFNPFLVYSFVALSEILIVAHSSPPPLECFLLFSCWLFLTLCDPMDCSPPGFSVHGIFQARILEWVTISYFRGSS